MNAVEREAVERVVAYLDHVSVLSVAKPNRWVEQSLNELRSLIANEAQCQTTTPSLESVIERTLRRLDSGQPYGENCRIMAVGILEACEQDLRALLDECRNGAENYEPMTKTGAAVAVITE